MKDKIIRNENFHKPCKTYPGLFSQLEPLVRRYNIIAFRFHLDIQIDPISIYILAKHVALW